MSAVRTPSLIHRELREYSAMEYAPLKAGQKRVDREQGVIYGVKIAGRESKNRHDVAGVAGTEYAPEAYRDALHLYEGLKVNANHPPRDAAGKPLKQDRKAEDRLGKTFGVYLSDGEVYGNLRLLKTHPLYETLMEAAASEDLSDMFALSHNAWGDGEVRNGKYVITRIPIVKSVDIVADGGTNRSLFESGEPPVQKVKLRALLESKPGLKPRYAKLLKLYEAAGDMDVDGEGKDDYRDHLHQARKLCEDAGDMETAGKIHAMMKPKEEGKEVEEDDEEQEGGEEEEEPKKEAKETEESLRSEVNLLKRENRLHRLCESEGVTLKPSQRKAALLLESEADVKAFLKDSGAGKRGPQSRSLIRPPAERETLESDEGAGVPKNADAQLAWLRN